MTGGSLEISGEGAQRITRSFGRPQQYSTLQYRRDAHAAGRANRNQAAFCLIRAQNLGERGNDTGAGGGKRMTDRKAAAFDVQFGPIDGAESGRQTQLLAAEIGIVPRLERAEHLTGESLMNLVEVEVLQAKSGVAQHSRDSVCGRHQEPFL